MANQDAGFLPKALTISRVGIGFFFVLFGEYKVFRSEFAHSGFARYLDGYIHQTAVSFYRPFLSRVVLPHAVFFGYTVGILELFIGVSLILGVCIRAASLLGMLHMLSLTLATWWDPGYQAPFWQYFGAELDHLPLLFFFMVFYAAAPVMSWSGRPRR